MLKRLRRGPSDASIGGAEPTPETAAARLACLAALHSGRWANPQGRANIDHPRFEEALAADDDNEAIQAAAILEGPDALEAFGLTADHPRTHSTRGRAHSRHRRVELTSDGGLLTGLVRQVLQTSLEVEMAEHLGYERNAPEGRGDLELAQRFFAQAGQDRHWRGGSAGSV